jgi:hypothetical protein
MEQKPDPPSPSGAEAKADVPRILNTGVRASPRYGDAARLNARRGHRAQAEDAP